MKTCPYCYAEMNDTDLTCPNCGKTIITLDELSKKEPKTIEELQVYCDLHHIPLAKMRFFLGINVHQPKVFGIYREDDQVIVYKNKSDGTRSIRYKGTNEAEAVKIILDKIYDERDIRIVNGITPAKKREEQRRKAKISLGEKIAVGFTIAMIATGIYLTVTTSNGYYTYNNNHFYNQNNHWYQFIVDDWYPVSDDFYDSDFYAHYDDYYDGGSYHSNYEYSNFEDSDYYEESDSWFDDDSDDWSDWGDSWDFGDTDWDSDW